MTSISNFNNGEAGSTVRSKINTNFTNLNNDKVETSVTVNTKPLSSNVVLTQDDVGSGTLNKVYTAAEQTKLATIQTGATANSADATLLARANHTGTQSADTLTDGTTNKAFLATERTKLAGIATGATANSSDATLLARANHTGTQLASTVSDFDLKANEAMGATSYEITGFKNNTDRTATTDCTIAFVDGTRTFTITPASGSYSFWNQGVKYTKSGAINVVIANTTGGHFIYFDATGTLVESTTPWNLLIHTPVCFVYWNATLGKGIPYEERHGNTMDGMTHAYLHAVNGTKYLTGLDISGYTLSTDGNAAVTWSIATGTISDEDLVSSLSTLADGGPYTLMERSGASGDWTWTTTSAVPYLNNGTDLQYNQFTGGVWTKTAITANNKWTTNYIMAVPSITTAYQILVIPGQTEYSTLSAANAETFSQLSLGTLPAQENVVLYKVVLRHGTTFTSTGRVQIDQVDLIRNSNVTIAGIAVTDHGTLSGLSDLDHPASAIINTPAGNISATNVQAAINELDTEKLSTTGTAADSAKIGGVTVTGTPGVGQAPVATSSTTATWQTVSGGGGGEANTASNVGTAGVGVFKVKSGIDLQFKKINAGSSKVTITDDTINDEVDIDIVEANIVHQNLSGAGTNTHTQIDSHISNTSNPHFTTPTQIGLGNVDNTSDITKNAAAVTLTNKTISLTSNTVSGTMAEFNTACSNGDFVYSGDNVNSLNMNVSKMLGRTTAGSGAVEEITPGNGLSFTAGTLVVSGTKANFDTACTDGNFVYTGDDITGKSASTDGLKSATTTVNVSSATAPTTGQVLTATSSTTATWQAASGGSNPIYSVYVAGEQTVGQVARFVSKGTQTLAGVIISLATLPTGANFSVQVYKNGTASTNSIFTSDATIDITTGQAASNGIYQTTKITIDNGSLVAGDVLYFYVTVIGSTLSGTNLEIIAY